jgi:hypothetical protein
VPAAWGPRWLCVKKTGLSGCGAPYLDTRFMYRHRRAALDRQSRLDNNGIRCSVNANPCCARDRHEAGSRLHATRLVAVETRGAEGPIKINKLLLSDCALRPGRMRPCPSTSPGRPTGFAKSDIDSTLILACVASRQAGRIAHDEGRALPIGGDSAGVLTRQTTGPRRRMPRQGARGCKSHEDLAVSMDPSRYGPEADPGYEQQGRS